MQSTAADSVHVCLDVRAAALESGAHICYKHRRKIMGGTARMNKAA